MSDIKLIQPLLLCLDESQASDIVTLDVSEQTSVTDFMVIATGRSGRHTKAIAMQAMEKMKALGMPAISSHGFEQGDWILVDFNNYILHVMTADSRAFYHIEGLWQQQG